MAADSLRRAREAWNTDKKEVPGFIAYPIKIPGSVERNLMEWDCVIAGKTGTAWQGGKYKMKMYFNEEYPAKPPMCQFAAGFFHPNVYPSGTVYMSILDADKGWNPSVTIRNILVGIHNLLDEPNLADPSQIECYELCYKDPEAYTKRVKQQPGVMLNRTMIYRKQ